MRIREHLCNSFEFFAMLHLMYRDRDRGHVAEKSEAHTLIYVAELCHQADVDK